MNAVGREDWMESVADYICDIYPSVQHLDNDKMMDHLVTPFSELLHNMKDKGVLNDVCVVTTYDIRRIWVQLTLADGVKWDCSFFVDDIVREDPVVAYNRAMGILETR